MLGLKLSLLVQNSNNLWIIRIVYEWKSYSFENSNGVFLLVSLQFICNGYKGNHSFNGTIISFCL